MDRGRDGGIERWTEGVRSNGINVFPLTLIWGDDANLVGLHSTSHQLKLLHIPRLHSVSVRGRGGKGIGG